MEAWQSQLCGTLIWSLYCLTDCWITSTWNTILPKAIGIILPYKEMWLCKENGEKMYLQLFIHRPEGTQMWFCMRHRSGFFKPLELKWTLSHHNPTVFFFLWRRKLVLLAAELLLLLWTVAQTTSFNDFPVSSIIMMWANMWSLI